jgi:hypothetical protein
MDQMLYQIAGNLMNQKINKRYYLVKNLDSILDLLAYYKQHASFIRDKDSVVLWKHGEQERYIKLNETS